MFTGIENALAVTALITFMNLVYARPWEQDERALLLPGILGGIIGYAIGTQAHQKKKWYLFWPILICGTMLALFLSLTYNNLLGMETKPMLYNMLLYSCFFAMNLAAFSVFGVIGWTFSAKSGKEGDVE